jgi:hypothetical protein
MSLKPVQLRPPHAEELAKRFEGWAEQARSGECTGYSMIAIRPGGTYTCDGWQSADADALHEIGMHVTMILDIWRNTIRS